MSYNLEIFKSKENTNPATIAEGGTVSSAFQLANSQLLVGIALPSDLRGVTSITISTSNEVDGAFLPVYEDDGTTAIGFTLGGTSRILLKQPAEIAGLLDFVKFTANTLTVGGSLQITPILKIVR